MLFPKDVQLRDQEVVEQIAPARLWLDVAISEKDQIIEDVTEDHPHPRSVHSGIPNDQHQDL